MRARIDEHGFAVSENVLPPELVPALGVAFREAVGDRPGVRTGLAFEVVQALARSPGVRALVEPLLGHGAFAFRATLFDKTMHANWFLAWHQDRVIPVQQRTDEVGFGPWSDKEDGVYVEPPTAILEQLLAVRVDLDGSGPRNGGLRLAAGTHRLGVLDRHQMQAHLAVHGSVCPEVPASGALCMRPLLAHCSSRSGAEAPRRIVHVEFAPAELRGHTKFRANVR